MSSSTADDAAVTATPTPSVPTTVGVVDGVAVNMSVDGGHRPEFDSSFLQHASGQGIAGIFAWAAIAVTCHQVRRKSCLETGNSCEEEEDLLSSVR